MFDVTGQRDTQPADALRHVIDRVLQHATNDLGGASFPDLDRCVTDAVMRLSGGAVAGYVPLLALREVRCCIVAGSCDCGVC